MLPRMTSSLWWSSFQPLPHGDTDTGHCSHLPVLLTSWSSRVLTSLCHTPLASWPFLVLFLSCILILIEVKEVSPVTFASMIAAVSVFQVLRKHLSWVVKVVPFKSDSKEVICTSWQPTLFPLPIYYPPRLWWQFYKFPSFLKPITPPWTQSSSVGDLASSSQPEMDRLNVPM